jgi:hypothetical protein
VLLGRERPSDQALTDLLRWSWSSGEAKGYHSVNTDFSKIHRSGVSKILLKGQTYAMPPAAKSGASRTCTVWGSASRTMSRPMSHCVQRVSPYS